MLHLLSCVFLRPPILNFFAVRPYFFPVYLFSFLKKKMNAPRLSEHPPARGKECHNVQSGGIIGCKDETSSWHLIGSPNESSIGSTVSSRGETHR